MTAPSNLLKPEELAELQRAMLAQNLSPDNYVWRLVETAVASEARCARLEGALQTAKGGLGAALAIIGDVVGPRVSVVKHAKKVVDDLWADEGTRAGFVSDTTKPKEPGE